MKNRLMSSGLRQFILTGTAALILFSFAPAMSADGIDPEADKVLKSMSIFLNNLSEFAATADIDNEFVDLSGQKLQLSSYGEIVMKRPGSFYIARKGAVADVERFLTARSCRYTAKN